MVLRLLKATKCSKPNGKVFIHGFKGNDHKTGLSLLIQKLRGSKDHQPSKFKNFQLFVKRFFGKWFKNWLPCALTKSLVRVKYRCSSEHFCMSAPGHCFSQVSGLTGLKHDCEPSGKP